MGKSRRMFAVQWTYADAPSQRLMTCDRGSVARVRTANGVAYCATAGDVVLGVFEKRKHAVEAVEGAAR